MAKRADREKMTRDEMRARLEDIARQDSNKSAQIQAMRLLREMDLEESENGVEEADQAVWEDLNRRYPGLRTKSAA